MNENRKLALHKESLSELTSREMRVVVCGHGGHPECQSKGCGACLETWVTCLDLYTVATCTCPTGPSCVCPTYACA